MNITSEIVHERVMLTPDLAREFLAKSDPRQRPLSYGWASTLSRDITYDRWDNEVSNDSIDFSKDGYMMNGQHRCLAVIMAEKPIMVNVRRNCPTEWFDMYDRSKARTMTDYYRKKDATVVTSMATFAVCIEEGAGLASALKGIISQHGSSRKYHTSPTTTEKMEYINAHEEELQKMARKGKGVYETFRYGRAACYADAIWLLRHFGADEQIVNDVVDDFKKDAPANRNIALLKSWFLKTLLEYERKRVPAPKDIHFTIILAAYEAYFYKGEIKGAKKYLDNCWESYKRQVDERRSAHE